MTYGALHGHAQLPVARFGAHLSWASTKQTAAALQVKVRISRTLRTICGAQNVFRAAIDNLLSPPEGTS